MKPLSTSSSSPLLQLLLLAAAAGAPLASGWVLGSPDAEGANVTLSGTGNTNCTRLQQNLARDPGGPRTWSIEFGGGSGCCIGFYRTEACQRLWRSVCSIVGDDVGRGGEDGVGGNVTIQLPPQPVNVRWFSVYGCAA